MLPDLALPSAYWMPASLLLAVLLVLAAITLVLRAARASGEAIKAESAVTAHRMGWAFVFGAVLWLIYGVTTGYGALWDADAFTRHAHAGAFWSVPLFIGAIVWVAALLVVRVIKLVLRSH